MSPRPLLLGHRGARAVRSIPENTFASFDRALADGCDGFEFDVRLTADGQAVVCHDARSHGVEISHVLAADLPELPLLRDVLIRYQHRAFLDIELKVAGLERLTAQLIRENTPNCGYVVSSFLPDVLHALSSEYSSIPLGLICETTPQLMPWRRLPVTHVMIHQRLALLGTIRELHAAGKKVVVWTVNGARVIQRLTAWNVEGIVSDQTELLVRTVGAKD